MNHQSRWNRANYLIHTFLFGPFPYFKRESTPALIDFLEIGERAQQALVEARR